MCIFLLLLQGRRRHIKRVIGAPYAVPAVRSSLHTMYNVQCVHARCTSCNICICIQFRVCIFYQALEVHRVSAHYCAQDLLVFHCTGCTGLLVHWYTVQCTVYQCTNSVHGALFSPHITGAPLLVFSPHITDSEHSTTPFIHVAPSRIQSA